MNNVVVTSSGSPVRTSSGDCLYTSSTNPMGPMCDTCMSKKKKCTTQNRHSVFDFNKSDLKLRLWLKFITSIQK